MSSSQNGTAAAPAKSHVASKTIGADRRSQTAITHTGGGESGSEIVDETAFRKALALERKRCERSGRSFILMLLDCSTLLKPGVQSLTIGPLVRTLSELTRETDIKGWHHGKDVLGVIFTETGETDGKILVKALLTKVADALCETLSIQDINEIRLSFHVFPQDLVKYADGEKLDLPLYPEQRKGTQPKPVASFIKRLIDVAGSATGLIVLSPVILAIALAIKLTSPGPVLFRQQRVGRHGKLFTFIKFRSMYLKNDETIHREYVSSFISGACDASQAEVNQKPVFKLKNDPRVTPIGRFIRKTSLDELPQFLNVLRGEMSLVGPRPPIPYEFARYETWHVRRVLQVNPGITGLWQVGGRSKMKFDDMVRLDIQYSETWSIWLDIKILLRTPGAVLSGEGAY